MNLEQQLGLLAAYADNHHDGRERKRVLRLMDTLGGEAADLKLAGLDGQVLRKQANGQIMSLMRGR